MHQLTQAIMNYVERSIDAALATPGSAERDRARTEKRVALQVLEEKIEQITATPSEPAGR